VDGLSVSLRQETPIPLHADFECAPGEVLVLIGPSGSGKSTILRAIAGTYRPAHGRVAVAGETWFDSVAGLNRPPHRRAAGMVFQNYALFPHMTALGNVMAAMGGHPPAERRRRAVELLELVHLGGLDARRPAELSGGQQQRVAVARALAREPKVLLFDEPFSAVDTATRQRLYREIAELRRVLAMPVVLVTHDLDEAVMLGDRMTVLHRGRTLQSGAPLDVVRRPASVDVARLVDMRNLFTGVVEGARADGAVTLLRWGSHVLEAAGRPDLEADTRVAWGIRAADIVLHRRDRPSRGERENPLFGDVVSFVPLGETAEIAMRVDGAGDDHPLHLSVSIHVARRNGIGPDTRIGVSLIADGIHLMPG
jgi:molybdate transport system ATP-binding protein